MHFTLKPLKSNLHEFKCVFRSHTTQSKPSLTQIYLDMTNMLNSCPLQLNVALHLQSTQNKPSRTQSKCSSTQMHLCTRNTFKFGHLQLKFALAVPIHSNEAFLNSYVPFHLQSTPNKFSSTQMHRCEPNTFKLGPLTLKFAFGFPIHSHEVL